MTKERGIISGNGTDEMRRICVFIGSRANYGRLLSVLKAIQNHPKLELKLVTGASALDMPMEFIPDVQIQCLADGDNLQAMTLTCSLALAQLGGVLERLKPDAVLLHGDRYEQLPIALTAAYMGIPLVHTEGGDITGTIDERVRHAVTKLADVHFPVTELSRRRIVAMGEYPDMVFTVGSTALDTIADIDLTNNRMEPYVLILHHPNTTKQEEFGKLVEAVNQLDIYKIWMNPNVDPGSKAMLKLIHRQDVEFSKNLSPEEYARLLYNCECAIGNSSSFIKEGAFLGVPAVLVGDRQKGREHGDNVVFADYDDILPKVKAQMGRRYPKDYRFGNGRAGKEIADILAEIELGREKKLCML